MRSRNIKAGFYKNADLAECSAFARLLAPGLWMLADRSGRLEDRPKQIKGEIFPFDNIDINTLLDELAHWNHIERYEVDGKKYIQILNFEKHQSPHIKEKQSVIPKSTRRAPDMHQTCTNLGESQNPLIPDILIPDCSSTEESASELKKNFDEFRRLYPKQRAGNRDKAFASYKQALKRANHDMIMEGLKAYVASEEVAIGRAKGCAAWLNDDRWTSDYSTKKREIDHGKSKIEASIDSLKRGAFAAQERSRGTGETAALAAPLLSNIEHIRQNT